MELFHGTDAWMDEHTELLSTDIIGFHKFACFERDSGLATSIFPFVKQHSDMVKNILKGWGLEEKAFLGAGKIVITPEKAVIDFDSNSCLEKYRRDKPEDPHVAAKILETLRTKVKDLII